MIDVFNALPRMARRWQVLLANLDRRNFSARLLQANADMAPAVSARVVFFNHYDLGGQVAAYVLHHVRALANNGLSVIFLTSSPDLDEAGLRALSPWCWLIGQRRNVGLDIGGWPCAMKLYETHSGRRLADAAQIFLTNDSVFGPLQPLEALINRMSARNCDIWGVTESAERGLHLQSYFLVFERRGPGFLADWLRGFRLFPDRETLIGRHEVGLSTEARAAGLTLSALQTHADLQALITAGEGLASDWVLKHHASRLGALNPTHFFWRACLVHFGCPYIKRDLLRNFERFDDDGEFWLDVIYRIAPDYPASLITDYLQRPY